MRKCFEEDVLSFSGLLYFYVIAGLDPAIHKDKSKVPVVRWILGAKPEGDYNRKNPGIIKGNGKDEKSGINLPLFSYCQG